MTDTKSGREKKGRNKRSQLDFYLIEREIDTLGNDDEPSRPSEPDELFADD